MWHECTYYLIFAPNNAVRMIMEKIKLIVFDGFSLACFFRNTFTYLLKWFLLLSQVIFSFACSILLKDGPNECVCNVLKSNIWVSDTLLSLVVVDDGEGAVSC